MAKQLVYQVALGETPGFYRRCLESVQTWCRRHGFDYRLQTEPELRIRPQNSQRSENALRLGYLPIFEKENAFRYLADYDQVAVIDADIWAREGAPNLFEGITAPFAGVLERDLPSNPAHAEKLVKHSRGQFGTLTDVDWHWNPRGAAFYNMGLMVMGPGFADHLHGQSPALFLQRPEFQRFIDGEGHWRWSTDQTLLNWWIKSTGMATQNLDWRWNALYGAVRPERIREAFFVHFFLAAKLPQGGREIAQLIQALA